MFNRYNTQKPVTGVQLNRGHPLSRDLVGCWLMNEGSGSIVNDLSGNNNTGTLVADTYWTGGKYGPALSLDGTDDSVSLGVIDLDELFHVTWCAWVKSPTALWSADQCIFGRYGPLNQHLIWGDAGTDAWQAIVSSAGGNIGAIGTVAPNTEWQFVCVVLNGATLSIYVDGVFDASDTNAGFGGLRADTINAITLGIDNDGSRDFTGLISHAMIYKRSLSYAEIVRLYRDPFIMFEREPIELWAAAAPAAAPEGNAGIMTTNSGYWGATF